MKKIDFNKIKDYLLEHLHDWLPFAIIIVVAIIGCAPFAARWLFVSNDYTSGGINTVGNTPGNVTNNAVVCQQGDWFYYRNDEDQTLYRCKTDGSQIEQVINDPGVSNINVVGEWIYYRYLGLHKVRVDGEGKTMLTDNACAYVNVVGDWIYFSNFSDNCNAYKIKTDGTHLTKIADMGSEGILVVDGYIYINDRFGTKNLYKLSVDAQDMSEAVVIAKDIFVFNVVDGWVYYANEADNNALYKVRIDGTEVTKLDDASVRVILAQDGKIFFADSAAGERVYSINTDGTEKRLLIDDECLNINYANNILFYTLVREGKYAPLHKLFLDANTGTLV